MEVELKVVTDEIRPNPWIEVPVQYRWSLVEFLGLHREAVSYDFHSTHFIVHFLRVNQACAQQLINDWALTERHGAISSA